MLRRVVANQLLADDQLEWLNQISEHIATSLEIKPDDFDYVPFSEHGGLGRAYQLFGNNLPHILTELNERLVH